MSLPAVRPGVPSRRQGSVGRLLSDGLYGAVVGAGRTDAIMGDDMSEGSGTARSGTNSGNAGNTMVGVGNGSDLATRQANEELLAQLKVAVKDAVAEAVAEEVTNAVSKAMSNVMIEMGRRLGSMSTEDSSHAGGVLARQGSSLSGGAGAFNSERVEETSSRFSACTRMRASSKTPATKDLRAT